jgi:ISXO2-like transposase domain
MQLGRQLGLSRYEPAWLMLQKLRRAMVAPDREPPKDEVEVDESSAAAWTRARTARASAARNRSAPVRSRPVAGARGGFACASSPMPRPPHWAASWRRVSSPARSCGPTAGPDTPGRLDLASTTVRVVGAPSALGSKEDLGPRLHRAVSNLKSWLRGTHRGVSRDHLQVYLDQFVFRFDRRGSPMAAFLLGLGSMHPPMTYQQITRRNQAAA